MEKIYGQFRLEGAPLYCGRYGSGHINDTYLLATDQPHLYILQRLNNKVFPNTQMLMRNLIAVTDHLRKQDSDPRHVLVLVPTLTGDPYLTTEEGDVWRLYEFITDSLCLDKSETVNDLLQSGVAFGSFQNQLADFPASTLGETIPRFHDTPNRFALLHKAIEADPLNRAKAVEAEIQRFLSHEQEADALLSLNRSGELPLRVTHNDTKLNNVMLDRRTRTPLCVIDLDTVMPGLAANDFGDGIRFGASTAAEDERDLSKVSMSLELFKAYATGFIGACGQRLRPLEIETLPMGAKLMTLECGARFLTDYLMGDVYFHIARPEHNLDRCRTQITLVEDMERKWEDMARIVAQAKE
ncbi:MAG: aminoglycoside phosphotransferase family protein [Eubacteriales bacterium]|nr:aminoglycoside phosphotransferase family protein [Eubacteriales bacterium]